jgi:hypothetical protein
MIDRESKKSKSENDNFQSKNEKLNIKKTYKIKNSNIKKMMEYLKLTN